MLKLTLIGLLLSMGAKAARVGIADTNFDVTSSYLSRHIDPSRNFNIDSKDSGVFTEAKFNLKLIDSFERLENLNTKMNDFEVLSPKETESLKELWSHKEIERNARGFSEFVHGTHVAGIATSGSQHELTLVKFDLVKNLYSSNLTEIEKQSLDDKHIDLDERVKKVVRQKFSFLLKLGTFFRTSNVGVVNFSWGMTGESLNVHSCSIVNYLGDACSDDHWLNKVFLDELKNLLTDFFKMNERIFFVVAAGNENTDLGKRPNLFTLKKFSNLIVVGALNNRGDKAPFSNYGAGDVDIYCPGNGIKSVIYGDRIMPMSGTSMAAPYATNEIGKVLDTSSLNKKEIISHLSTNTACREQVEY